MTQALPAIANVARLATALAAGRHEIGGHLHLEPPNGWPRTPDPAQMRVVVNRAGWCRVYWSRR